MPQDPILLTGVAGFIGCHVGLRLLGEGESVVGVDSINSYYDPELKQARLALFQGNRSFAFHRLDLADRAATEALFREHRFRAVVHMAAQPGVRYSLDHPYSYLDSNLTGFLNVLEACRHARVPHLVFASSSSVYGLNRQVPFSEHHTADHPISLYAASKKANELMAHTYSHLFGIPCTGLRFFTVYGPWGRPDMGVSIFAAAIMDGKPIRLFNDGRMRRDFTYVDDVAEAVTRVMRRPPAPNASWSATAPDPATSSARWRIYNIGNNRPVAVTRLVELLEQELGRKAVVELAPMQPGDVEETWADIEDLARDFGFKPTTSIEEGIRRFAEWYRGYRGI